MSHLLWAVALFGVAGLDIGVGVAALTGPQPFPFSTALANVGVVAFSIVVLAAHDLVHGRHGRWR